MCFVSSREKLRLFKIHIPVIKYSKRLIWIPSSVVPRGDGFQYLKWYIMLDNFPFAGNFKCRFCLKKYDDGLVGIKPKFRLRHHELVDLYRIPLIDYCLTSTYHRICNMNNSTISISGAGTAYHSGVPDFTLFLVGFALLDFNCLMQWFVDHFYYEL